jgi:hypothetical protein
VGPQASTTASRDTIHPAAKLRAFETLIVISLSDHRQKRE